MTKRDITILCKIILFVVLSIAVVQFFYQRESFNPWNKYGAIAIVNMPSKSTKTTRMEYDYVAKKFPYKDAPKSNPIPISPITARQIALRNP
tara:strand:+ start:14568 stop:14843 length:276 start_codon:yes stop_codon:yes gene_type:complete